MEVQELVFTNTNGTWTASYVSQGDTVVQLVRRGDGGRVIVYACIDGMKKTPIDVLTGNMFMVCVPAGLTVTLESENEVTAAKRQAVE